MKGQVQFIFTYNLSSGVKVDHSSMQRWVKAFIPLIEEQARRRKKPVNGSWRMDETYIKVKGKCCNLYHAVDKEGSTIDFLLCKNRDTEAAKRFFKKAIESNGVPLKINIDKSGANTAALEEINKDEKPLEKSRLKFEESSI